MGSLQCLVHGGKCFLCLFQKSEDDRGAELIIIGLIHFQDLLKCVHVKHIAQLMLLPAFLRERILTHVSKMLRLPGARDGTQEFGPLARRRDDEGLTLVSAELMMPVSNVSLSTEGVFRCTEAPGMVKF